MQSVCTVFYTHSESSTVADRIQDYVGCEIWERDASQLERAHTQLHCAASTYRFNSQKHFTGLLIVWIWSSKSALSVCNTLACTYTHTGVHTRVCVPEWARSVKRTYLVSTTQQKLKERGGINKREAWWEMGSAPKQTIDSLVTHSVDNWEPLGRTSK